MDRGVFYTLILAASLFLFVIIYNYILEIRNKNSIIGEIERDFGKNVKKDLPKIYDSLFKEFGGNIDDITFNDLELKLFLKKYNHTYSSFGMDYFYYRLRNQYFSKGEILREISKRKEILKNIDKTKKTLFYFANIGYFKNSLIDFLNKDIEIKNENKVLTYILSFSVIYIIIAAILFKEFAVFVAIILMVLNAQIARSVEKETNINLDSIMNLKSMLYLAKAIKKDNNEIFKDEIKEIDEILNKTKKLSNSIKSFKFLTGNLEMDFADKYKDYIFLSQARSLMNASKYINLYRDDLKRLYRLLGSIEGEIAASSIVLANNLKDTEVIEKGIFGKAIVNPIVNNCVPNDLDLRSSILLTGSNASGKSTYLRTCGMNLILATTFGFFYGEELKTELIEVKSVIDISDSIEKNISYFMAEAIAIKRLIDDNNKKLILLDEIFRGTNTIDRISSASFTLKYLDKYNYVISATHDIELTTILDNFRNAHFEEKIVDGDIFFDYLLKEGPTNSKNAIAILKSKNYPDEIIKGATELSQKLEQR